QTIHQSLQLILAAQNIYVIGMGVSALHATLLVNCAEPYLFRKIKEINAICGIERAFRYINLLNEQDLIIAITLPHYAKHLVELLQIAREKSCKILALTDSATSPIVPFADLALFTPASHAVLPASNVAMIALIESLSSAIALAMQ